MAKKTKHVISKKQPKEQDGAYLLKLLLYVIVGSQWLRVVDPTLTKQVPIPIGLVVGLFFASHDHFQIDRKIEYAVLIVAMFLGFWLQNGILVTLLK